MKWMETSLAPLRMEVRPGISCLFNPLHFRLGFRGHCQEYLLSSGEPREFQWEWENILFRLKTQWMISRKNPEILIFQGAVETSEDCEFSIETWMDTEGQEDLSSPFCKVIPDQEDHSCGCVLEGAEGWKAAVCETTQLMSSSFRIKEQLEGIRRQYQVTAWKDTPVKLEKFIVVEGEADSYVLLALAKCRAAAKTGSTAIQKGSRISVSLIQE